jgi:hypothetical protein
MGGKDFINKNLFRSVNVNVSCGIEKVRVIEVVDLGKHGAALEIMTVQHGDGILKILGVVAL